MPSTASHLPGRARQLPMAPIMPHSGHTDKAALSCMSQGPHQPVLLRTILEMRKVRSREGEKASSILPGVLVLGIGRMVALGARWLPGCALASGASSSRTGK